MLRKVLLCAVPLLGLGLVALSFSSVTASGVPLNKVKAVKIVDVGKTGIPAPDRVSVVTVPNRINVINRLNVVSKVNVVSKLDKLNVINRVDRLDRVNRINIIVPTCPDMIPRFDERIVR